jgi:Ca2+/H+ antiporter, TMEM165/GDT1 family
VPASSSEKDPLAVKPITIGKGEAESATLIQPLHSFLLAFTMIIFSEIGDKTFLVAALMAMKHPPLLVFSAAFAALTVMTILSAILGHAVPVLLSVRITNFLAAFLFLIFGLKMLREGYALSPTAGVGEEMREVEMELEEKEQLARKMNWRRGSVSPYVLESGRSSRKSRSNSRLPAPPDSPPSSPDSRSPSPSRSQNLRGVVAGINNLCSFLLSPAWVQTFVMTFLGEWGDRSQIATIAMSAGQDYWWVATGSLFGHSLCTAAAVIGGRAIAGRVSLRVGKFTCAIIVESWDISDMNSYPWWSFCFPRVRYHLSCRSYLLQIISTIPFLIKKKKKKKEKTSYGKRSKFTTIQYVLSLQALNRFLYP